MTQAERKVIKAKVGPPGLARGRGDIPRACRVFGYSHAHGTT